MVTYYLFRLLSFLVPLLPVSLAYWLADCTGELGYAIGRRARANVESNLRHVLGPQTKPEQLRALAREAFRTQARNYLDLFRIPRLKLAEVDRLVEVEGWERWQEALAQGKGLIVVAAHLGNLEIVAMKAVVRGYAVTLPVEPLKPPKLFDLVLRLRRSQGLNVVAADETALKAIFRALRRNEVVALGADRDILGNGVEVPFFGQPALLPPAAALVALRTGSPILPVRSSRRPDGGYAAYVAEPIWLRPSGDRQRDVREGTARMAATLEEFIGAQPGQWVMFEDVWNKDKERSSLRANSQHGDKESCPLSLEGRGLG